MQYLTPTKVIAMVRTIGAIGRFESRVFSLMLPPGNSDKNHKEAIRILQQIGYETNGLSIEA